MESDVTVTPSNVLVVRQLPFDADEAQVRLQFSILSQSLTR